MFNPRAIFQIGDLVKIVDKSHPLAGDICPVYVIVEIKITPDGFVMYSVYPKTNLVFVSEWRLAGI